MDADYVNATGEIRNVQTKQTKVPPKQTTSNPISTKTRVLVVGIVGTLVVASIIAIAITLVIKNSPRSDASSSTGEECQFRCDMNITCLNETSVCDGTTQCHDQTDELGCPTPGPTTDLCANGVLCDGNNTCITSAKLCNNETDCIDGADEVNCTEYITVTQKAISNNLTFTCPDFTKISSSKVCDLTEDCLGGRDEENCARSTSGSARDVQLFNIINNDFVSICSTEWDGEKSKMLCQYLGFSDVQSTSYELYSGEMVTASGRTLVQWVNSDLTCNSSERIVLICLPNDCGSYTPPNHKIVGGSDATIEEHPWQVSLQSLVAGNTYTHFCGGVVVDQNTVLTAAHCVYQSDINKLQILAGTSSLLNGGSGYSLQSFTIHPEYDDATLNADIAVLKTSTPIDLSTGKVKAICLPTPGQIFADNTSVKVTGWGSLQESSNANSQSLQKVTVQMVNYDTCKVSYDSDITEYKVCAGILEGGKDACQGDSGGPLVYRKSGTKYTLVGLVSSGKGCARANFPGIYTEVSEFITWIRKYMT